MMPDFFRLFRRHVTIAVLSIVMITLHFMLRYVFHATDAIVGIPACDFPLVLTLICGGGLLLVELLRKLLQRQFGSDLLAGISIVTSFLLDEYLAGSIVVLMLSGGEALEGYAVRRASSVLEALARRMPSVAHRKQAGRLEDIMLEAIEIGEVLVILPHEICPVDGTVMEGHGVMDESYLTGEPYTMSKTPGSTVLSGAINSDAALTIRADRRATDSRYAKIIQVMRLGTATAEHAAVGRSARRLVRASGDSSRTGRMGIKWRIDALSRRPRRRHALSTSHCDSYRGHWCSHFVSPARHHYQRSGSPRNDRHMHDCHFRQDWNANHRRTKTDRDRRTFRI